MGNVKPLDFNRCCLVHAQKAEDILEHDGGVGIPVLIQIYPDLLARKYLEMSTPTIRLNLCFTCPSLCSRLEGMY